MQVAKLLVTTSTPVAALRGKVVANGVINLEKLVIKAVDAGKAAAAAQAKAAAEAAAKAKAQVVAKAAALKAAQAAALKAVQAAAQKAAGR